MQQNAIARRPSRTSPGSEKESHLIVHVVHEHGPPSFAGPTGRGERAQGRERTGTGARRARRTTRGASATTRADGTRDNAAGVVFVEALGLKEVESLVAAEGVPEVKAVLAGDAGADDEDEEEEQHGEVEDGVADDATLAELGLLEGVDWRPDLAAVKSN